MEIVTPLAGVWIEIKNLFNLCLTVTVTPLAGVWIEITRAPTPEATAILSLPLRECGLKSRIGGIKNLRRMSLPLRECGLKYVMPPLLSHTYCHSPCGSVD